MDLQVDYTTERFIEMLRQVMRDEPVVPDLDRHDGHHLAEVAMNHYEWQRRIGALRLLIGVRLVNEALEQ